MADEQKLKYTVELGKTGSGGKDAARELQEVGKAAETSGKSLAAAGREFKAAIAAVAGAAILRESIQAFTEQDAAIRRLNGTLIALGRTGGDASRQLQQLSQAVTLPPGASRNSVLDAISELVRNGASTSELPRLTQMVLDLAAAGYSVERSADAMGNAVSGDFGKLSKILNVDFPAAAGRAHNLAEALQLVEQRFGGLAASTAGGLGGGLAEFNENLTKIKASLGEIVLTGLQPIVKELGSAAAFWAELVNGKAPAPYVRPGWAPGGPLGGAAPDAANPRQFLDPALAALTLKQADISIATSAARDPAARIGLQPVDSDPGIIQQKRLAALQAVFDAGLILEEQYDRDRTEIVQRGELERALIANAGVQALREAESQMLGAAAAAQNQISRDYEQRVLLVRAYFAEIAAGAATEEESINRLRAGEDAMRRLGQQAEIARFAASDLGRELQDVGRRGTEAFAAGFSKTLVDGIRTGRFEFRQFASEFLAQIAQMILQAVILATLRKAFSGTSAGSFLGFAEGGFAPRAMAVGGVQHVSSATYFPRFNAVAGEAGSEVLAVLSKPRFMQIGGLQSYVGSVAGSELAMTNARDLRSAVGGQRAGVGGQIVVEVRGTKDFEARIVDSSIEGAVVRVVNDLHQDTPVSSAVKGLTA